MKSICVFCGSSSGNRPEYAAAARELGGRLAHTGRTLIYGGGNIGLMGVVADAALAAGGEVIGVIPQFLMEKELGHGAVTRLEVVASMHERKARMAELADAFVALPGGFGTFEEFCEVLTWSQLSLHRKPCGLLNVSGFFDPLLALFDRAVADGLLRPAHRMLVLDSDRSEELLTRLSDPVTAADKWIDRDRV